MRPAFRANAPSAAWVMRVPAHSHTYPCQSWRPVSLSSASSTRSISAIRSGHITLNQNEGIIYINNIFPRRLQSLLRGPLSHVQPLEWLLKRSNRPDVAASEPLKIARHVIPRSLNIEIKDVVPRYKEGGAFVKYARKSKATDQIICDAIQFHLKSNPIRPWFNPFQVAGADLVRGRPWIEDLYRIPSQTLKVEFLPDSTEGPPEELTQEALYSLFRPYGKITDIQQQPSDSKILPRYATIRFDRPRYAVMARNCMHGYAASEEEGGGKSRTRFKINYERKIRVSMIKDWLFSHPRIVIPAIAALVATITVIVFDPIRTFFIKLKIKSSLHTAENAAITWIRKQASKANQIYFGQRKGDPRGLTAIWEDRQNDISQLRAWLSETAETFIVIHGPRGSGKRELVLEQALKDHHFKVIIDCKQIQDARGDTAKISRAAAQVGYRPIFSWMNSISSFIDLAAQGMIGTKAGFSETLDAQLNKIWQNTAVAMKRLALESRNRNDKDATLSDDEYLEAHPERRPVVIIDNFVYDAEDSIVLDKLTQWAASLTAANIAHVIFLTTDSSFSKPLSKALPNQVFRTIGLGDCSLEVGRRFVLNHLEEATDAVEEVEGDEKSKDATQGIDGLDACIQILGGRVTDLEFMAHRIKAGETPQAAVKRIIEQSASEILKIFVLSTDSASTQWSTEQAWHIIKSLAEAKDEQLLYNKILLHELFKENGEATLRALEQAELITIASEQGFPQCIKPGKPVYKAAFEKLLENSNLKSRMKYLVASMLVSNENKSITKYEQELQLLGSLPKHPYEIKQRIQWLERKIYKAQSKIDRWEWDLV
ncbi:Mitochondrial escape protein 2 [Penicillium malachiteum]|uniref:Mitochondrial escape protein 2 n=1 Tax=Penicillium malachiteum TaxID=1324776 RepID=UPI002548A5D2|nr:Mitochondrial escape protein 2 [Penicillium malachiteum]KAJ5726542.1 Mitochondrial escape protein 2 [Penicillium malachiteum]